jgi:hypothetical protein
VQRATSNKLPISSANTSLKSIPHLKKISMNTQIIHKPKAKPFCSLHISQFTFMRFVAGFGFNLLRNTKWNYQVGVLHPSRTIFSLGRVYRVGPGLVFIFA